LINRLVDDFVLKRKDGDEEIVKCDGCDNDENISAYCPNCNIFLCCACNDVHKKAKTCHNVGTVVLSSQRSGSQSSDYVCEEHGYELKHYCDTCDKLVCLYCTIKEHSDHDHDIVKKKAGKYRDEMKKIIAPVQGMAKNLSKAHDNVDSLKKRIQEQGEEINAKIDQSYEELFQKLMAQKEQLKKELSIAVSQVGKMATAQQEEIESVQEKLLKVKELSECIEGGSDQQALSTKSQLVDSKKELDSVYKKLHLQPAMSDTITFIPTDKTLPQFAQLSVFGKPFSLKNLTNSKIENIPRHIFEGNKVELKIISKDNNGRKCPIGGCQVSVQLESSIGEVTTAQVHDNSDGSYMISFTVEHVGETKLSVFIDGKEIKGSPHHFTVFKNYLSLQRTNKTLGADGNINLVNPWGIAFSRNGTCAVADNYNHCVFIFNCKNQLVRKIGQAGTRKGQFKSPRGLAFDDANYLYVADYGNDRVQKLSTGGQYVLQLDSYALSLGSGFYKMNYPTGIATYDDKVYVTERTTSKGYISVFLSNGRFCFTIGSKEMSEPYDITVRADEQLLVADCNKNCIFVYTPDGVYLRRFSTGGSSKGQLNSPFSLTTDLNLFVFVADTWNNRVSIFDKDGNHVHSFGTEGSANHQFKRPHGIALSPESKIYLSDYGNSRIQIFLF